jgi:hypothetical protein
MMMYAAKLTPTSCHIHASQIDHVDVRFKLTTSNTRNLTSSTHINIHINVDTMIRVTEYSSSVAIRIMRRIKDHGMRAKGCLAIHPRST